eukprot:3594439-Pleurochrysis_carterae.AAC.1
MRKHSIPVVVLTQAISHRSCTSVASSLQQPVIRVYQSEAPLTRHKYTRSILCEAVYQPVEI